MNILITGGAGFIGSHLASELNKNNNVYIYDLKKTSSKIKFIKGSIMDSKKIRNILIKHNIKIIFHFAAVLGVKKTERNPVNVLKINLEGTLSLLKSLKETYVKKIIFSSSSEVYGDGKKRPMSEIDILNPKSIYGHTKIIGEELVKTYSKLHNIKYNILRFFNICGKGQKNNFVISKFTQLIKYNKDINIYGHGNQIRSFCHVKDAVNGIIKIMQKGKNNEIYNIGNDNEPITIKKLAKKIIKISKKKIKNKITFLN